MKKETIEEEIIEEETIEEEEIIEEETIEEETIEEEEITEEEFEQQIIEEETVIVTEEEVLEEIEDTDDAIYITSTWFGDLQLGADGLYTGVEGYDFNNGTMPFDGYNCQLLWDLLRERDNLLNRLHQLYFSSCSFGRTTTDIGHQ